LTEREFEWDDAKAARNARKHRVEFREAETVWLDPNRIEAPDETHSDEEERSVTIGLSSRLRLLAVVFTERHEAIRIISARRANQAETRRYTGES
jgi:uncharacterized DUF497 family protein